jgi:hypothetical protein
VDNLNNLSLVTDSFVKLAQVSVGYFIITALLILEVWTLCRADTSSVFRAIGFAGGVEVTSDSNTWVKI